VPASTDNEQPKPSTGRQILETIVMVAIAFAVAQLVKTYLVQPFVVPSGSMIPTIQEGNRVLAEKTTYRFTRGPEYLDIAVFKNPAGNPPILIKRVIATGGQTVDLREGKVFIDGAPLDEPYTHSLPSLPEDPTITYPYTVPDDSVWMMGDNRTNSGDSREFGPVKVSEVMGRAVWTYWPPSEFGTLQ
jgi:signal peptidase I